MSRTFPHVTATSTDYIDSPGRLGLIRDLIAVVLIAVGGMAVLLVAVIAAFQISVLFGVAATGLVFLIAGIALGLTR